MSRSFVVEYPHLRPTFWGYNGHLQTLASFFVPQPRSNRQPLRYVVNLLDGDRMVIHDDQASSWITGDRIAILIAGLCGCHDSGYVRRVAIRLRREGIRTIRVDMRGFGFSTLISRGHLHAGRSRDIQQVVEFVQQLSPLSKISLVGYSLGANIMLKLLTEWGERYPTRVDSAIAVSPPIDLGYCANRLRAFGNRLYDYYFARRLSQNVMYRRRRVSNLIDNGLIRMPDRLVHFDDQFTAPVSGFSGAREYYARCSTIDSLKQVSVPTVIVAAQDDPIIPFDQFDTALLSSRIELVATRNGGHLGFLGNHPRDPDGYWLDWRICHWLQTLDNRRTV